MYRRDIAVKESILENLPPNIIPHFSYRIFKLVLRTHYIYTYYANMFYFLSLLNVSKYTYRAIRTFVMLSQICE